MQHFEKSEKTTSKLFFVTFFISVFIVLGIGQALNWNSSFIENKVEGPQLFLYFHTILSLTSLILISFASITKYLTIKIKSYDVWICLSTVMSAFLYLSNINHSIPQNHYLFLSMFFQVFLLWNLSQLLLSLFKFEASWKHIPSITIAIVFSSILYLITFHVNDRSMLNHATYIRNGLFFLFAIICIIIITYSKNFRIHDKSLKENFLLRIANNETKLQNLTIFSLIIFSILLEQSIISLLDLSHHNTSLFLNTIPLVYLFILPISWYQLENFFYNQYRSNLINTLTPKPIRRFMFRHNQSNAQNWAATIGLKSVEYYIDHDINNVINNNLPITIAQIRTEEIKKCIQKLFGSFILNQEFIGSRIHGSIDPESTVNPCIETIKFFSCLYLEATSLVEKRLSGLVSLLPLVDPALSKTLNQNVLIELSKHNQWFLYLDYDWVDQILTREQNEAKYRVKLNHLDIKYRNKMVEWARQHGANKNIWLSENALNKLKKEAPSLIPIVHEMKIEQLNFYYIAFEEIVPRLQTMFNLDAMQKSIIDFMPSNQSSKIFSILQKRIQQINQNEQFKEIVTTIESYQWFGFKEKDNALQLVLMIWKKHHELNNAQEDILNDFRQHLLRVVSKIGYPSQFIHSAQIDKISLRDTKKILNIASNPKHKRFEESWLILATRDYRFVSDLEKKEYLSFFANFFQNNHLNKNAFANQFYLDSLLEFTLNTFSFFNDELINFWNQYTLMQLNKSIHTTSLISTIDRIHFLSIEKNIKIPLDQTIYHQILDYLKQLEQSPQNDSSYTSLKNRIKLIS